MLFSYVLWDDESDPCQPCPRCKRHKKKPKDNEKSCDTPEIPADLIRCGLAQWHQVGRNFASCWKWLEALRARQILDVKNIEK